jgi:hypothetical protein
VRFFVPGAFLGGEASKQWAYVVALSAADLSPGVALGLAPSFFSEQSDTLMILPLCRGRCQDRFGSTHEDIDGLPPLVDITVPRGSSQEEILRDYNTATGRRVSLPGVVPAEAGANPP